MLLLDWNSCELLWHTYIHKQRTGSEDETVARSEKKTSDHRTQKDETCDRCIPSTKNK